MLFIAILIMSVVTDRFLFMIWIGLYQQLFSWVLSASESEEYTKIMLKKCLVSLFRSSS
jgi:hypothetical protein